MSARASSSCTAEVAATKLPGLPWVFLLATTAAAGSDLAGPGRHVGWLCSVVMPPVRAPALADRGAVFRHIFSAPTPRPRAPRMPRRRPFFSLLFHFLAGYRLRKVVDVLKGYVFEDYQAETDIGFILFVGLGAIVPY